MANALNNIAKSFDKELVTPLHQRMVGRKLIAKNQEYSNKGIGLESVDVWSLAEMSDASISMGLPTGYGDTADVTATTLKLPILSEPFKLPRRMVESYKQQGIGISAAQAIEAAYKVQVQEEALIINGWAPDGATYVIEGFNQVAGNSEASSEDFGTYGNAIAKTALVLAELDNDSVYAECNMVLNPTQANQLNGSYSSTGASEYQIVLEMLNRGNKNGAGQIFSTPTQTVATGFVSAVANKTYADLVVPQDYKTQLNEDSKLGKLSPIYGMVYASLAPRFHKDVAICTMTNI